MFMQNPVKNQFVQKTTDDALNLMEGKLTKFHLPDYEGSNGLEKLNFVKYRPISAACHIERISRHKIQLFINFHS